MNKVSDMAVNYDHDLVPLEIHRVMQGESEELLLVSTTSRRKIMSRTDWPKFKIAENEQLSKHFGHKLYGELIP